MNVFFTTVRRDRPLYLAVFAYVAACWLLSNALGQGDKFLPLMYLGRWIALLVILFVIYISWIGLESAGSRRTLRAIGSRIAEKVPPFAAGAMLCIALALLHGTYTSTKTIIPDLYPFRFDVFLADLDRSIHVVDPWRLLTWLNPVTDLLQPLYSVVWLLLVVLVTTLATTLSRSVELRAQYAWTFILCWTLLGNLMSSLTLAAGPAYFEKVAGSGRFHELTNYLAQHDGPLSAHRIQERLWTAYSEQTIGLASGISAFPSMHVSMATLFTLYGFRINRSLGMVFAAYGVLVLLGSVHLGWHYAVDGYVSILATLAIWKMVAWATRRFPSGEIRERATVLAGPRLGKGVRT
jgi:hypothetical protein